MTKILIIKDHNRGTMYFPCKEGDVLKLASDSIVRFGAGDYAYKTVQGYVDADYAEMIVKEKANELPPYVPNLPANVGARSFELF